MKLPEVRSACAKALGAMVQGVGEEELSKVLPWLLKTLQSEASPVDRSGAAQGISEVLKTQVHYVWRLISILYMYINVRAFFPFFLRISST